MKKQAFFFSLIIVMVLSVSSSQAILVATVSTSADYDTYTDSDSGTSFDLAIPVEAHAHTWLPGETSDYGKSDAWAAIGDSVRAYSKAQGAYGGVITTSANAMQTTEWQITSDTLEFGTPVSVLLDVSFDGSLYSVGTTIASASALLDLGDTTIYQASGTSGYYNTFDSTGAWSGDFTRSSGFSYLDTTDRITFETQVGQIFTLKLSLQTEAYVSCASETGALADFSNSGLYTFAGAENPGAGNPLDVQFEIVPEPTMLLFLGLGSLSLIRKRRVLLVRH